METSNISIQKDPYKTLVKVARNKLCHSKSLHQHPYSVKMIVPSFGLVLECKVEAYTPVLSIYSEVRRVAISNSSSLLHLSPEQKRQLLGSSSSFYAVTSQSSQCLSSELTFGQLFRDETAIEIYLLNREELLYWPKKRITNNVSPARKSNSNVPLVTTYSPAFLKQGKTLSSSIQPANEPKSIPNITEQAESDTEALESSSFDIQMLPIQTAPTLRSESSNVYKSPNITKTTTADIQLVSSSATLTKKEALSIQEIQRLTKALQEEKRSSQRLQEKVEVLERQRSEIETVLIDLKMTTDALKSMETNIPASTPVVSKPTTSKGNIFSRKKTVPAPAPPPISLGSTPPPPPPPVLAPASSSAPKSLADMIKEKSSTRDSAATFKDPLESKQSCEGSNEPKTTSFLEELQKRQSSRKESGREFLDPELLKQNRSSASLTGERSIIDEIRDRNSQRSAVKTPFIDPIEARKAEKAKALQEAIDLRSGLRKTSTLSSNIPSQDAAQPALFASPVFRKRQAIVEESVSKREQEIRGNATISQVKVTTKEPILTKSRLSKPEVSEPKDSEIVKESTVDPVSVENQETKHTDSDLLNSTTQIVSIFPEKDAAILDTKIKEIQLSPEKRPSLTPGSIDIDNNSIESNQAGVIKDVSIENQSKILNREKRKELSEITKLNLAAALESIDKEKRVKETADTSSAPIQSVVDDMPSLTLPHSEPGVSYFDDIDDIDVTISIGESAIQRIETSQEVDHNDSASLEPKKIPPTPPPFASFDSSKQSTDFNRESSEKIGVSISSNHRSSRIK